MIFMIFVCIMPMHHSIIFRFLGCTIGAGEDEGGYVCMFNWLQLLLSLSVKLDSLQIVVPHAGRVLQDAPSRTFTILYTNDQATMFQFLTSHNFDSVFFTRCDMFHLNRLLTYYRLATHARRRPPQNSFASILVLPWPSTLSARRSVKMIGILRRFRTWALRWYV